MKTHTSRGALALAILLLAGCANNFTTRDYVPDDAKGVNGVVYYELRPYMIVHTFTALVDKDGKSLSGACVQSKQKEEIAILPNYRRRKVIINRPSLFASGKFSVEIDGNGALKSINSESSPTGGAVATAAGTVLAAAVTGEYTLVAAGVTAAATSNSNKMLNNVPLSLGSYVATTPDCNGAPVISSVTPYEFKDGTGP